MILTQNGIENYNNLVLFVKFLGKKYENVIEIYSKYQDLLNNTNSVNFDKSASTFGEGICLYN